MVIDFEELKASQEELFTKIRFLKIGQEYIKAQLDKIEKKLDETKIQNEKTIMKLWLNLV